MRHEIHIADVMRGREPALILWDDVAGTVDGAHSAVPALQRHLASSPPVRLGDIIGELVLRDPRHRPEDFLALLWRVVTAHWSLDDLPSSLIGVRPTGIRGEELPDGVPA